MTDVINNIANQIGNRKNNNNKNELIPGLWLGFGVVTIIELFGLAMLILNVLCQKAAGQEHITSEQRHKNVSSPNPHISTNSLQNIDYISDHLKTKADLDTDDSLTESDASKEKDDVDPYGDDDEEEADAEPPKIA